MALPEMTTISYLEEARDRSTYLFKDKDVFDRYLQLLIAQQTAIQDVFKDLLQKRSIETAEGVNLDVIGEIVGQPRELISTDLFDFFGFEGALKAGSFGDVDSIAVGSRFLDFGEPLAGNVLLDDTTYRLFIKAKILKNTTASTPEEFISLINFMFGTESTSITEGTAEYTVLFGRELTVFEQVLLNYVTRGQGYESRLIPKTVGVRINFGYFNEGNYFGFQGTPRVKGFGNASADGFGYNNQGYYIWTPTYDASLTYDGSTTYTSVKTFVPNTTSVEYIWMPSHNGGETHDGGSTHSSQLIRVITENAYQSGGIFATLI